MTTYTLPEHDELQRRLAAFDDDPFLTKHIYPAILARSGQPQFGGGLVMLLQLAVADCTDGMTALQAKTVALRSEGIIRAVVDDPEVLSEALDMLRAVGLA